MVLVLLTGCAATPEPRVAAPVETPAAETPKPECTEISAATLAAVDASVTAKGEGNSVPDAVARIDEESGKWFIVGPYAGPADTGTEGAPLGIWATDGDVTDPGFDADLVSPVRGWSTAPYAAELDFGMDGHPALGCWPRR